MKKTLILSVLTLILLLETVGVLSSPIKAEEYNTTQDSYGYNFSCGNNFEVDEINDSGNFDVKGCYLSLEAAETKMKENEDYVVRYAKSKSPMKIVSMNGGLVYGFPRRKNQATISIYENSDETGLSTYTSTAYEMVYEGTTQVVTSGSYAGYGILKVNLNGFVGYTDLELVDLVPFKFIDDEISCYVGKDADSAQSFIVRQNYFVAKRNGNYTDLYLNYARGVKHPSANDATQSGEMLIGGAPEEMTLNIHYYSKDGVTFYTDNHYQNYAFTNYNYFQYLSLRSEATITKSQINSYLSYKNKTSSVFYGNNAQAFINGQNTYGMNALLVFALACNESSYGTNLIETNNIFGLGAYDSDPSANALEFDSIAQCVNEFDGWHLAKYCDYYYGSSSFQYYTAPYFGNKGVGISVKYMSDPYECYKVAGIAYDFDKFINNYDGTYTNYNAYDLALVNAKKVNFYSLADTSSTVFYKSKAGNYTNYEKDCVVTVLGSEGNFAKVISTNPINENRTLIQVTGMTTYNHDYSYAYVEINKLTPLNDEEMFTSFGEYEFNLTSFDWNEDVLHIVASCSVENLTEAANCTFFFDGKKDITSSLTVSQVDDEITIDSDISLSDLTSGKYTLSVKTKYPNHKQYNQNTLLDCSNLLSSKVIGNKLYSFRYENNALNLYVADVKESYESLLSVRELSLTKDEDTNEIELHISGVGALKGVDGLVADNIKHELLFINMETGEELSYEMDNTSSVFSINDGYYYNECGFETTLCIDNIVDLVNGSYCLKVKTSLDSIESVDYIKTINMNYANISVQDEERNYRITINDLYLNRLELDIENIYEEIDYSLIRKVEERTSFTNITDIRFEEEQLKINAAAMIYYLNYEDSEDVTYNVYLIDDENENIIEMDTEQTLNKYNYQTNFKSSYNMDHISFESSCALEDMEEGNYRILVKVTVTDKEETYLDYIELLQKFDIERDSYEDENFNYSFEVSDIRDCLILKVSENNEVPVE